MEDSIIAPAGQEELGFTDRICVVEDLGGAEAQGKTSGVLEGIPGLDVC